MNYSLFTGVILVLTGIQAAATSGQNIEMNMGTLQKVTLIKEDGEIKTYQLDSQIQRMLLTDDGKSLSMGATTKCDSYMGSTESDQKVQAAIVKKGELKLASPQAIVFVIPKGTSVVGHCGTKSNELLSAIFERTGKQKFWLKEPSNANVIGTAEQAEINAEAARQARITKAMLDADKAIQLSAFAEARSILLQLTREELSSAQDKQLEAISNKMPKGELSVAALSSSYKVGQFQRRFHQDLSAFSLTDLIQMVLGFADGNVKSFEVAEAKPRANGAVYGEDMTGSAISQLGYLVTDRRIRENLNTVEALQIMQALQKISDMAVLKAQQEFAQTDQLSFETGYDVALSLRFLAQFMQTNSEAKVYVAQMQKVLELTKNYDVRRRESYIDDTSRVASYSIDEFNLDVPGLKEVQEQAARR